MPFIIPPGDVPEGMVPEGVTPEGAEPFIIPAGGVPEGAVLFVCSLICGVPDGAAAAVSMVSTEVGVDDVTTVPADCCEALVVLCVQPAIRITAMRSADPISISILLLFMEYHLKYRVHLLVVGAPVSCVCVLPAGISIQGREIPYLPVQLPFYRGAHA